MESTSLLQAAVALAITAAGICYKPGAALLQGGRRGCRRRPLLQSGRRRAARRPARPAAVAANGASHFYNLDVGVLQGGRRGHQRRRLLQTTAAVATIWEAACCEDAGKAVGEARTAVPRASARWSCHSGALVLREPRVVQVCKVVRGVLRWMYFSGFFLCVCGSAGR